MRKVLEGLAVGAGVVVATLGFVGVAQAAPPALLSVGHQDRHPTATFSAPGADSATVYLASRPDRATDGSFLSENVEDLDFLSSDEIQRGAWLHASQIDPGFYYVMLDASDYDCYGTPACTEGYSNVMTVNVPKPLPSFRARVDVFRYSGVTYPKLTVRPLGERLPYRVCWRLKNNRRKCASGVVAGYDWNSSADDELSISMRGMAKRTKFTWYVNGRAVAAKTVNTTRR